MNKKEEILKLTKEYFRENLQPKKYENRVDFLPVSGKVLCDKDITNIVESALDGWFTEGRFNKSFEHKLKDFIGCRSAITVNSGSSANLVAISSLCSPDLGDNRMMPGDEVITVAAGFPTTINPIIQNGLIPVFVDIELDTFNVDVSQLSEALSDKTKAVFLAHTLGNPFDINEVKKFCIENNLYLIEDCCDALGATYNGKHVGNFGDISTLSFYPAHHITMGEGGAVFSNNLKVSKISKSIRDWGRDCWCPTGMDNTCHKRFNWKLGSLPQGFDHKYTYSNLGYNFKITDMQAALGDSQIDKIDFFVEKRRRNFNLLRDLIRSLDSELFIAKDQENSNPSYFGFPVCLRKNSKKNRSELIDHLHKHKIATRNLFAGNIIRQPYFLSGKYDFRYIGSLTNTDHVMNNFLWIGISPMLSEDNISYMAESLMSFWR